MALKNDIIMVSVWADIAGLWTFPGMGKNLQFLAEILG